MLICVVESASSPVTVCVCYTCPATSLASMIMSADHPGLTFTLSLVRTEPTYNQPMQQWSFVSDFAVGSYIYTSFVITMNIFWISPLLYHTVQILTQSSLWAYSMYCHKSVKYKMKFKTFSMSFWSVDPRLFRHIHGEADSLQRRPQWRVQHSPSLPPPRASHLRHGHPLPTGQPLPNTNHFIYCNSTLWSIAPLLIIMHH